VKSVEKENEEMKLSKNITVVLAALAVLGPAAFAQKPADLVGTWVGQATLDGVDSPNTLTLVLELKEGKLEGGMVDEYGTINDKIGDIVLEKDAFNFTAPVMGPGGQQATIHFKMKISEKTMKGTIEIPEVGMTGTWESTKVK
jgi:hypothetical protein